MLQATGVKGGLIVHLGCGDGSFTAALRVSDKFLVHGLDTNVANVARARERSETDGFMKVFVDADTQEILGAAILGINGDEVVQMTRNELIQLISDAIREVGGS